MMRTPSLKIICNVGSVGTKVTIQYGASDHSEGQIVRSYQSRLLSAIRNSIQTVNFITPYSLVLKLFCLMK